MAEVMVSYRYRQPSRLGGAGGPAQLVLETSLTLSPEISRGFSGEGGHKEAHRFLTVVADAVATAGKVELPAGVVEAAGRKGSSKLVTEAKRLVAL